MNSVLTHILWYLKKHFLQIKKSRISLFTLLSYLRILFFQFWIGFWYIFLSITGKTKTISDKIIKIIKLTHIQDKKNKSNIYHAQNTLLNRMLIKKTFF